MLAQYTLQVPPIHLWNVALSSDIHSVPSLLMPLLENQLVPAAWQFIKQLSSPLKAMVVLKTTVGPCDYGRKGKILFFLKLLLYVGYESFLC